MFEPSTTRKGTQTMHKSPRILIRCGDRFHRAILEREGADFIQVSYLLDTGIASRPKLCLHRLFPKANMHRERDLRAIRGEIRHVEERQTRAETYRDWLTDENQLARLYAELDATERQNASRERA